MTDLRAALIEAGAVKLYGLDGGRPEIWDNIGDEMRRVYREKAAAIIDTSLDTLADRADEWEDQALSLNDPWAGPVELIAVLRDVDEYKGADGD